MDSGSTTSHVRRTAVLSDLSILVNFEIGATPQLFRQAAALRVLISSTTNGIDLQFTR